MSKEKAENCNSCIRGFYKNERKVLYTAIAILASLVFYVLGTLSIGDRYTLQDAKVLYTLLNQQECISYDKDQIEDLYAAYGKLDRLSGTIQSTPFKEWLEGK